MNRIKQKSGTERNWWKYLLAAVILIIYLLPVYVVVVMSLKPMTDHTSRLLPPVEIYLENYLKVFKNSNILNAMKNSLIITVGTVAIVVIAGCLAAYPIARNKGRLGRAVKIFVLGVMMVPGMSMVVGVYSTLVSIHAISTYWGIILVSAAFGLPFSIYMYSNFIAAIPDTLDEAAAIDGADVLTIFFKIIFPQLKPVTVSVLLMQGVSTWNEYGYSLYILQKPDMYNVTLTVKQFFGEQLKDLNGAAASAAVAIIPVIIIYLFLQKYFVKGAIDSAVKG
ncbi:carbohydrate ABC transporter permease [Parablautia muri]|uniref:Carbohydrate ABC transporter permease n=1 Tax=Parablautia muri TaxID=2320879 RepID=A0A9X5BHL4_9FIRM|nr:carbohydrate ABC transporter permease [Parablautia muri]NBJ94230.1 carbohydrate ABC transporter permease [Parablautia muri]